MTYCVGLKLDRGLVFLSDTRTNAGVDNVSKFRKMYTWEVPGERAIVIMTAGNLATTQTTIGLLDDRSHKLSDREPTLLQVSTMFQAAQLAGQTMREVIAHSTGSGQSASSDFHGSMLVGGQIGKGPPTLFLVYPEGNFVEASEDTPFLQIGEIKYGRPILVRAYDPAMSFADAIKLLLVSFDSTAKANLSVGMPLDVAVYETGSLAIGTRFRIDDDDERFHMVSNGWSQALREAFDSLPVADFGL